MHNPKSEILGTLTRSGFPGQSLKQIQSPNPEAGLRNARSVLECGGSPPLSAGGRLADQRKRRSSGAVQTLARTFTLLAFLLSAFSFGAWGQSYSLDWSTIDGGGGTSTGGVYSVTGTIGQPEAGPPAHAGGYSLQGGFWGIIAAVQTPDAPYLTVFRTTTNTVVVSWPLPAEGWDLQATNTLPHVATPWPQLPPPYQTNGANLQFIEPVPVGTKFYRLIKP